MKAQDSEKTTNTDGDLGRWIGMLLPAVAWAIQLQTVWLTTEYGCESGNFSRNHAASAITLAAAITGGIIAWSYLPAPPPDPVDETEKAAEHKRLMGILGIVLSVFFSVVIIAQWLPTIVGVPCHK